MIDFATNYNYLGPPNGIHDFAKANIEDAIGRYVSHSDTTVVDAISRYLDVPVENVARGNGATDILYGLPGILQQDRAVCFTPSFWGYGLANERLGIMIEEIPLTTENDFVFELEPIEAKLRLGSAAIYFCNPNNPTGTMVSKDEVVRLSETYPASDFVIDETYLPFRKGFEIETLSTEAVKSNNIHVVHSFSKFFTSPGLRSGALISNVDTVARFTASQIPHMASTLSQILTPWLLEQTDFIRSTRAEVAVQSDYTYESFRTLLGDDFSFTRPNANFIFARSKDGRKDITERLTDYSLIVRDGKIYGDHMADCFRFCVREKADTTLLALALKEISETQVH